MSKNKVYDLDHEHKEMRLLKKAKKGIRTAKREIDVMDKMHVKFKKKKKSY